MKKDIQHLDDIKLMVDTFYGKVKKDKILAPIFNETIKDNWSLHLEKMYRFWETILLNVHSYTGAPFPPHIKLNISEKHFQIWISLFVTNMDELFEGFVADEAKTRAQKMAEIFTYKLDYMQKNKLN